MSAPRTRAQLGRSVLARSKDDERAVAAYLREHGYPQAERAVRTGFKPVGDRGADPGDITNTPGLVVSVKSVEDIAAIERTVPAWLVDLDQMRTADLDPVRLLIVHRFGKRDVGQWWAFQWAYQFAELAGVRVESDRMQMLAYPVRTTVADAVPLVRADRTDAVA